MYQDIKGKRLLVLGGSRWSLDIVDCAHRMGLIVYVTDNNPASPCKEIADYSYNISCLDVDAVVELCENQRIEGIITGFVDLLLPSYAEICEKTGLPCYGTKELFELFTNKKKYKDLCRQYGVPVIEEYDIDAASFDAKIDSVQFPVIVKPTDDSGSRGITICNNIRELRHALDGAYEVSRSGKCIVERYCDTEEVMVYWIIDDGDYYLSAIANRHVKHINGESIIPALVGFTFPSSVTSDYLKTTAPYVKQMLKSVKVNNGLMFMQCKVIDGECRVFDIGFRLTGSLEYHIIEKICGYNSLEALIYFAVTGKMGIDPKMINPNLTQYGYSVVGQAKEGYIRDISGVKSVTQMEGVTNVFLMHNPGETITSKYVGTLQQVIYRVHGTVNEKRKLFPTIKRVMDSIAVYSDDNTNMLLPGIAEEDLNGRI